MRDRCPLKPLVADLTFEDQERLYPRLYPQAKYLEFRATKNPAKSVI